MSAKPNTAAIGILVMDARIERIPGDVGNSATFSFPVVCRTVAGATLERLIRERDRTLLKPFIEAGWELVRQGVRALATSCGFMILFQEELARAFPVPVFTSSLLQLPFIQAGLPPEPDRNHHRRRLQPDARAPAHGRGRHGPDHGDRA